MPAANFITSRGHQRFLHVRVLEQNSFNFTSFDAESSYLQLRVQPAHKLEGAVSSVARYISSLVKTIGTIPAKAVGNKLFSSELRVVQVTSSEAIAASVELPGNATRHRLQILVEDVDLCIGDRSTDRYVTLKLACVRGCVTAGEGRVFGWAVAVNQL